MADSAVAPLLPPPAGGAEARGGSAWGVYLAVALTALGPVSFGYVLGFSSPAAAPLLASGMLTAGQLNMFEALSPLGAIAGAGCAGVAADYLGRTRALALCCAPFALGWALISAAEVRSAKPAALRRAKRACKAWARPLQPRGAAAQAQPPSAGGAGPNSAPFAPRCAERGHALRRTTAHRRRRRLRAQHCAGLRRRDRANHVRPAPNIHRVLPAP
jgi:hypothetical protein